MKHGEREEKHLTEMQLEKLFLRNQEGETSGNAHLAICEQCSSWMDTRSQHEEHFRASVFPRSVQTVESALASRPARWNLRKWSLPFIAVAVPAMLFLIFSRTDGNSEKRASPDPVIASKGIAPDFRAVAKRGEEVFAVTSSTILHPGDQLRFVLRPGDYSHALLVSVDGANTASVYFPFGESESGALPARASYHGPYETPGSVTLDNVLGPERLFVLFSNEPRQARTVQQVLERAKYDLETARKSLGASILLGLEVIKQ